MNWIPAIEVENAHGTREVSLTTRHLMNRRIFLNGSIDADMANDFLSELLFLEESDEPLISGGVGGSATSIKNISDSILETRSIINGILSKHTGKTADEIEKATSFDNTMNADEAIKFGLCDSITRSIRIE